MVVIDAQSPESLGNLDWLQDDSDSEMAVVKSNEAFEGGWAAY